MKATLETPFSRCCSAIDFPYTRDNHEDTPLNHRVYSASIEMEIRFFLSSHIYLYNLWNSDYCCNVRVFLFFWPSSSEERVRRFYLLPIPFSPLSLVLHLPTS